MKEGQYITYLRMNEQTLETEEVTSKIYAIIGNQIILANGDRIITLKSNV